MKRVSTLVNQELTLKEVDLLNKDSLAEIFKEYEVEAVIHFAALKAVGESVKKPMAYYHNNVTGTINLLEAMKNAPKPCNTIIFSSSACVYGENPSCEEDHPSKAMNPYG